MIQFTLDSNSFPPMVSQVDGKYIVIDRESTYPLALFTPICNIIKLIPTLNQLKAHLSTQQ